MRARRSSALAAALLLAAVLLATGRPAVADQADALAHLAPGLKRSAISEALTAVSCAKANGVGIDANRLAIIDYTRSSMHSRLWVFDLQRNELLFEELVAHGKKSGDDVPTAFSNRNGSYKSSLGLFLTDETYDGGNGYSLKLHGLSGPLNAAAMDRKIVMHGAPYVDPEVAVKLGRLGRSLGCPAVRLEVAHPLIDAIKEGQFLYAYGPGSAAAKKCDTRALALHFDRNATATASNR